MGINNILLPPSATREYSILAYEQALRSEGHERCSERFHEDGYARLALYAKGEMPTHAARETADGRWTSKIGLDIDMSHRLEGLEGREYGTVQTVFRRAVQD